MTWSFVANVDTALNDADHRNYFFNKLVNDPNILPYGPISVNYSTPDTFVVDFTDEITDSHDLSTLYQIENVQFYGAKPDRFPMRNVSANYPPSSVHDYNSDFEVGSLWVNKSTNESFICYDNTIDNAVWHTAPTIDSAVNDGTVLQYSTSTNGWVNNSGKYNSSAISALTMYKGGVNDPPFNNLISGVSTYLFDKSTMQELFFDFVVPPNYKEGSDINVVVHWVPTTTNPGDVVWGFDYAWVNPGSVFTTLTSINLISSSNSVSLEHIQSAFDPISGSGKQMASILKCRIFRNISSINDTYTNQAGLLYLELKYEQSGTGSSSLWTK